MHTKELSGPGSRQSWGGDFHSQPESWGRQVGPLCIIGRTEAQRAPCYGLGYIFLFGTSLLFHVQF